MLKLLLLLYILLASMAIGGPLYAAGSDDETLLLRPGDETELELEQDNRAARQPLLDDPAQPPFYEPEWVSPRRKILPNLGYGVSAGFTLKSPGVHEFGSKNIHKLPLRLGGRVGPTLYVGGEGLGFDLALAFVVEDAGERFDTIYGPQVYAGAAYRFAHGWTAVQLGLGAEAAMLFGKRIDRSWEAGLRLPASVTFYPVPHLGVFLEGALTSGACMLDTPHLTVLLPGIESRAYAWYVGGELSLGVRFP